MPAAEGRGEGAGQKGTIKTTEGWLGKRVWKWAIIVSVMVCLSFLIALVYFPSINLGPRIGSRASCMGNLKQIGLALALYADNYQGRFPPEVGAKGLDYLLRTGLVDETNGVRMFHCDKDRRKLTETLEKHGLKRMSYRFEYEGAKTVINI